jgi:hypothetical protein
MTHPKSSEIAREIVESAWKAVDTDEGADYRPLDKALIKRITAAIVEARASALPSREEVFEAFKNYYGKTGNGLRWQGGVFVYDWLTENMTAGLKSVDDVPSREPTEDEYNQVIEVNGVSYVTLKNHRDKMKAASSALPSEERYNKDLLEQGFIVENEYLKWLRAHSRPVESGKVGEEEGPNLDALYRAALGYQIRTQGGICGQAFTEYECAKCRLKTSHHNTNTPIFCDDCTKELRAHFKAQREAMQSKGSK